MRYLIAILALSSATTWVAHAQPVQAPTPTERALQATVTDQLNALVAAHAQMAAAQDKIADLQKKLDEMKKPSPVDSAPKPP